VVDDNAHAAGVIAEMLQSMSFAVSQAHSGAKALDMLQAAASADQPLDLVLLDWQMPEMDGLEVARRITELHLARPPRMMMVTAFGREDVLNAAQRHGIEEVLIKPLNASVMFDTLMLVLGRAACAVPLSAAPAASLPVSDGGVGPGEHRARLRGARVLVVEDNELNQQVAREILEEAEVSVDLACHGEQGLAMLQANAYDLVLMDMQMPVMDGLEATRRLRADPVLSHLPVIAMTANALLADRQRCLDAGMSDHIAKPIVPEQLWNTLERWLAPRDGAGNAVQADSRSAATRSAKDACLPSDIPGLDLAQGLRNTMGRHTLLAETLRRFLDGHEVAPARIAKALAEGDHVLALREAHTLRGLAAMVGATELQEDAGRLEEALRTAQAQEHAAAVPTLLEELEVSLNRLLRALQAWRTTPPAGTPSMASRADPAPGGRARARAARSTLAQLHALLEADDPAAGAFVRAHAEQVQQAMGPAMASLRKHIEQFDYESALAEIGRRRTDLGQAPVRPPGRWRKGSSHAT